MFTLASICSQSQAIQYVSACPNVHTRLFHTHTLHTHTHTHFTHTHTHIMNIKEDYLVCICKSILYVYTYPSIYTHIPTYIEVYSIIYSVHMYAYMYIDIFYTPAYVPSLRLFSMYPHAPTYIHVYAIINIKENYLVRKCQSILYVYHIPRQIHIFQHISKYILLYILYICIHACIYINLYTYVSPICPQFQAIQYAYACPNVHTRLCHSEHSRRLFSMYMQVYIICISYPKIYTHVPTYIEVHYVIFPVHMYTYTYIYIFIHMYIYIYIYT